MANKNEVILQARAEVEAAKKKILELTASVEALGKATGALADKKFEFAAADSIAKLDLLNQKLDDFAAKTESTSKRSRKASKETTQDIIQSVDDQIAAAERSVNQVEKAVDRKVKKNKDAAKSAQQASQDEIDATNKTATGVDKSINDQIKDIDKLLSALEEEARVSKQTALDELNAAREAANAREREINKTQFALVQQQAAQEKAARKAEEAAAREAAAAEKAAQKAAELARKKQDAALAADQLAGKVTGAARAIQAFFASIVISKIISFTEEITRAGAAYENFSNTLVAALGDQAKADAAIEHLKKTADIFGVSIETLLQRFGRFKIAADSVGFSVAETETIFDAFVGVSRALGNTNEQTERTFVALEQIMSKGVVQSEELKQQLGDSLVGAYNKLGAAMGLTGLEFEKQLKNNQILAKESIPKLVQAYLELAGPAIQKNLTSLNAELARMENAVFLAKVEIADKAKPELLEFLRIVKIVGTEGALSFKNIGEATGGLLHNIRDLVVAVDALLRLDLKSFGAQIFARMIESLRLTAGLFITVGAEAARFFTLVHTGSVDAANKMGDAFRKGAEDSLKAFDRAAKFFEDQTSAAKRAAELKVQFEEEANAEIIALQEKIRALVAKGDEEALQRQKELTKSELAELKKREQGFEAFYAKIADLAAKQPGLSAPEVPTGGGLGALVRDDDVQKITAVDERIRKLTESIQALRDEKKQLEEDPYVTGGQLERVHEIDDSIRKLQATLERTKEVVANNELESELDAQARAAARTAEAFQKFGQDVQKTLVDLVRDNDTFRESFAQLDTDSQQAIINMIAQLESLASSGNATQADFQAFLATLTQIFESGGVLSQEFAAELTASFGAGEQSASALLTRFSELNEAHAAAGEAATAAATKTVEAEKVKQEAVTETGTLFIQSQLEQQAQAEATAVVTEKAAIDSLAGVADASKKTQAEVAAGTAVMLDDTGRAAAQVTGIVQAATNKTTVIIKAAAAEVAAVQSDMVQAVSVAADQAVPKITNTLHEGEGAARKFGDVVVTVGKDGTKAVTNIGEAAGKTAEAIQSTVDVITNNEGKITGFQSHVEQAGDAAVEAFKASKTAVADTVAPVKDVEKATTGVKTSSEGMAKAAAQAGTKFEDVKKATDTLQASINSAREALVAFNVEARISVQLANELKTVIDSIDI